MPVPTPLGPAQLRSVGNRKGVPPNYIKICPRFPR